MAVHGNREPWLSWRRGCYVLMGILILTFIFNALPNKSSAPLSKTIHNLYPSKDAAIHQFGNVTAFNENVDGLTDAQCTSAFPDLYTDIDRAIAYWKGRPHTISSNDIDIEHPRAGMRILIHQNELRILQSKSAVDPVYAAPDRAEGILHLLQRALDTSTALGEELPTIEVALNFVDDASPPETEGDTHSYWGFARSLSKDSHQRVWLMPNFDFWYYLAAGSFSDAKRAAMQHDDAFTNKIQKVVWRGSEDYGPEIRNALLDATKGKSWADVSGKDSKVWMPIDEFCKYALTVYTEGVTYSGRLKFLMNCQSLLIVHEPAYETHYSHLITTSGPEQNAVLVKRDFSDLEDKVTYYLSHPDEAEKIIQNSLKTFRSRYTTRAATTCYLRRLIRGYASVAETPNVWDSSGKVLRGRPYAKFMHEPEDVDFEKPEAQTQGPYGGSSLR